MKKLHILIPSLVATVSMPFIGLVGCGGQDDPTPSPVPPSPEDCILIYNWDVLPDSRNYGLWSDTIDGNILLPNTVYKFWIDMGEWKHSRSKYDIDDLYLCIRSDTAYDCLTMTDLQIFYDGNLLDNEYCSIVEVQEDGSKWTKIRIDRWEVPEDFLLANVICGQIKTGTQQTTGATTFTLAFRGWTE